MRTRYLASVLGIFLAAGQPRIAMSAVLEQDGLTLRIPASPTLVLRINAAFKPLLPLRIPIAGKTTADRRIFVDADAESSIRRLVIVQYETVNPGVKFAFVYPARPPAEFGGQTYQFYAYVHDDERAAAKSPDAEAGLTRAFLVEQGFRVPRLFRLARLARVADRDGQSEVIVFYIDNADADFAPGPLPGADEDGDLALDAAAKQAILERLKSAVHPVSATMIRGRGAHRPLTGMARRSGSIGLRVSGSVQGRSGRGGGRRDAKAPPVFDLHVPSRPFHRAENRRIDGSILSLAIISNSMIRHGFRVSPGGYLRADGAFAPVHLAIPVHDLSAARRYYRPSLAWPEGRSSKECVDFDFFGHQLVTLGKCTRVQSVQGSFEVVREVNAASLRLNGDIRYHSSRGSFDYIVSSGALRGAQSSGGRS